MDQRKSYFQRNRLALSVFGGIWALPNTAIGVVLGLAGVNRWQMHDGTIEVIMKNGPVHFVTRKLGISAFTLGDCVLYNVEPCENLRQHEGRHTNQYWILGPLFLPIYFLLLGIRGYYNHPLEKDARNYEARACGSLYGSQIKKHSMTSSSHKKIPGS